MPGLMNATRSRVAPTEVAEEVAVRALPRRRLRWPGHVAMVLVAGLTAGALSQVIREGSGILIWVLTFLVAVLVGAVGARDRQRGKSIDKMIEAANPLLGAGAPTRDLVKASHWRDTRWHFWGGIPARLEFRYAATVVDNDPKFVQTLVSQVSRRMDVQYQVRKNIPRKCIVHLELAPPVEVVIQSEAEDRVEVVINDVLGADAAITTIMNDAGDVSAVDVQHKRGNAITQPRYRDRIEHVVSCRLPGRWRAVWDMERDHVRFEPRPVLAGKIAHPALKAPEGDARSTYSSFQARYGVDEDNRCMTWMPSRNPHHIVTGTSGSGKTVVMQGLLAEFAWAGWKIFVNDAKLIEFLGFKTWPNVQLVASNTSEQIRLLHYAFDLMEERYRLIVTGQANETDFEPVVFFLDEFADFREELGDWYVEVKRKGEPTQPPVLRRVRSVARKGRTARVHFVVGLQRPDAEFLTGEVRDNFSARTSMGRLSPQGAMMMWENAGTGVAIPRGTQGRGTTLDEMGRPVEFQAYWTPDPRKTSPDNVKDIAILDSLRPPVVTYERLMILEPVVIPDLDSNEETPDMPSYAEIAGARIVKYDPVTAPDGGKTFALAVTQSASSSAPPAAVADEESSELDSYRDPVVVSVDSLAPGDLVCVDADNDTWGVVEDVDVDILDEECISVDYLDFETGEPNTVSVGQGEHITARSPK